MGKHQKTIDTVETAYAVLAEHNPMTVRQIYYQLVSGQVIENNIGQYKAVSAALVEARKDGVIPWDWVEDRLRRPRTVSMWDDLASFADTARKSYRRDVWATQRGYVECWLEKDALSGIFEDILSSYGVTLNVGRGYDGWASLRNAAQRYSAYDDVSILYFGDFDPSGDDMVRSLIERLGFFGCEPEIVKCALTADDMERYSLPPAPTKLTDTRRAGFIAKNGDNCVELDALPLDVLQARIIAEVEERMDLDALQNVKAQEKTDKSKLVKVLSRL